ncbi:hypothetical protein ACEWY4_022485 [Coilia grayii]|uniref:Syndecan/Neurexin domain-containing protein n=1 Tax=Coilia grayii TaxID=363190 RepID=A0ABD1J641_9TELE
MKASWLAAWLLLAGLSIHLGHTSSVLVEDLDGSGGDDEDDEGSGSGEWSGAGSDHHVTSTSIPRLTPAGDIIIPGVNGFDTKSEFSDDSDITFDLLPVTGNIPPPQGQGTRSFLEDKETLAAVISGGVGALVLALVLIGAVVYFMKRKEKANYGVAQHPHVNTTYHKAPTKDEFIIA